MPNSRSLSRQETLVRLLHRRHELSITDLVTLLRISEWTVRRDLKMLEEAGVIERYHGGVRLSDSPNREFFLPPEQLKSDEYTFRAKQAIGVAAARLLEPYKQVVLGAGTTTFQVAKALQSFNRSYSIVTNALDIAQQLAQVPRMQVTCTGGDVHGDYFTLVGPVTERALRTYFFDVAVIGVSGLSEKEGLTVNNQLNAVTLELMIEHSSVVIIVLDSSKFEKVSFAYLARLEDIDVIVTDKPPMPNLAKALSLKKVELVVS